MAAANAIKTLTIWDTQVESHIYTYMYIYENSSNIKKFGSDTFTWAYI